MTARKQQSNKSSKRRQKRKTKARAAFTSKPHILLKRDQSGVVGDLLDLDATEVFVDIPGYEPASHNHRFAVSKWLTASAAAVSAGTASVTVHISSVASLLKSNS